MDLRNMSRLHSSVAIPTGSLTSSRPSAVKVQKLGLKFSTLNGQSIKDVGRVTSRRANCSAAGSKTRFNVRADHINVSANAIQTLQRTVPGDRYVDQEIVTLKGKLRLSRTIGKDSKPTVEFSEFQKSVWFTLVSTQLDEQGNMKKSARTQLQDNCNDADEFYEIAFSVESDFGEPGALIVDSRSNEEFYIQLLQLKSPDSSQSYDFPCNSWINQKSEENYKITAASPQYQKHFNETLVIDRIFFTNKVYLPNDTPPGLQILRNFEMATMRGNGTGERNPWDRVYDYDVYNDLGNAEAKVFRATLGGPGNIPYPRRCRTGRKIDPDTGMETLPPRQGYQREKTYIPRDEDFSKVKESGFLADSILGLAATLLPIFQAKFDETPDDFDSFEEVFNLYIDGVDYFPKHPELQPTQAEKDAVLAFLKQNLYAQLGGIPGGDIQNIKYPTPQVIADNPLAWMDDEEFGRQMLAGINPGVIKRAKVFPPTSTLPEEIYGPATALTAQHIESNLWSHGRKMTAAEAVQAKRLFTIDYHDIYLPYVEKINAQTDTKRHIYAPRAFFFLTDNRQMKPVAIELSLPPPRNGELKGQHKVFTPPAFKHQHDCEWELAKLHFISVNFGYHELVSHWLKCHCVMEPFVIASHRQLSAMHPIFVLLDPCFVNTMRINANARATLIACAPAGTIESNFTPGKYGTEMSAVVYDKFWRFDRVGLPEDLLDRGMAEPDYLAPGGVKLLFDDYPFAKDALDVWNATKDYITGYVKLFYKTDENVREDEELQAWWKEIREVGHGDKKDEPWWPTCKTVESLIGVLCNIFWIAGPQHAAVNFGQYGYCGFMLNNPPMTRMPIPEPNTTEYKRMLFNFEKYIFRVTSSPQQTVKIMTTLKVLSSHAKDEEYIGQRLDGNWTSDPEVKKVFQKYSDLLGRLELMFKQRNEKTELINRHGALMKTGYTLMYPTSEPGITGKGIPWSISI
ncbi:hypothetical protein Mapa_013696 [Marchantia paleacea]|nr:hypothetical protein Mapa_013696 [Marchantia paleacea]